MAQAAEVALGSGFAALDDLAQESRRGYQLVHASPSLAPTLARHLERRVSARGRQAICVDGVGCCEPWRELAQRLGVTEEDPRAVAQLLVERAGQAVIVVCAPRATRWGAAVADALACAALESAAWEGWVVEISTERRSRHAEALRVAEPTATSDVERFWLALLRAERHGGRSSSEGLQSLERAWWDGRNAPPVETTTSADANRALRRLALIGRSVDRATQRRLGVTPWRAELLDTGLVAMDGQERLWLRSPIPGTASAADTQEVAAELLRSDDPWDLLRAAELWLAIDEVQAGLAAAERALRLVSPFARDDLWFRLERQRDAAKLDGQALLALSALALKLGDVEPALAFARAAAQVAGDDSTTLLALGRALAARGDATGAEALLERAVERATHAAERRSAQVELAEVLAAAGARERADALAQEVWHDAEQLTTRLAASSVIGKLLMARGDWAAATERFAEDARVADAEGELEAALRASLNQAVALMGAGSSGHAEELLHRIVVDAGRGKSARAEAFAASNLAVLAGERHDYASALVFRERALDAFRHIGNRSWLARSIVYLADLRIELGLVDEAEQALAFARQVLGPVAPPTQAAWLGLVATRVHLERERFDRAHVEIERALSAAERSTDGTIAADCHMLAARVALAQADSGRARDALARAGALTVRPSQGVEHDLVAARLAAHDGERFEAIAQRALAAARSLGDRGRMAEAHELLHHAALATGDGARATAERAAAAAIHEAIATSLPSGLCARYAARRASGSRGLAAVCAGPPRGAAATRAPDCDEPASESRPRVGVDELATTPVAPAGSSVPVASTTRKLAPGGAARGAMIGSAPSMLRMLERLEKVAPTGVTVLVYGESGTGKELVADAIHRTSDRHGGPLVKVNCAALVETLLLSELFGHEKGAFTGATHQRQGCFELAQGGTVFLDEIGDISPATQAALLRVLQERSFHRVGGTALVEVDVRVICATHRDLAALVAAGTFREDLYYRLAGMVLEVPPLRDRVADIPLLAAEVLLRMARSTGTSLKRLDAEALRLLSSQPWPGNVRELENVLRAGALFTDGDTIAAADLQRHAASLHRSLGEPAVTASLDEGNERPEDVVYAAVRGGAGLRELQRRLELECIVRALSETDGHVTRAAALLGIKRPRLSQLIKQHKLRATGDDS